MKIANQEIPRISRLMMSEYSISHDLSNKQIEQLLELFKQMWWSKDCTLDEVNIMLKNSISFALIENATSNLVGYARVLTDEIKYAFIFDVMIAEVLRGKRLGKLLMQTIISDSRFKNVKNFELTCVPEMLPFYEKFGFSKDYGLKSIPMRYRK